MADEKTPGTEPQIDMSRLEASMQAAAGRAIADAQRNARPAPPVHATEPDPVADVLRPYVVPLAQAMNLKADDAKDAAIFYHTTAEAGAFAADIEAKFNECVANGRPMNRASIWQWYKGANFDKFADARQKHRDDEIKRAREAQTVQGSRGGVPAGRPQIDVNASDEDLASAIRGLQF